MVPRSLFIGNGNLKRRRRCRENDNNFDCRSLGLTTSYENMLETISNAELHFNELLKLPGEYLIKMLGDKSPTIPITTEEQRVYCRVTVSTES